MANRLDETGSLRPIKEQNLTQEQPGEKRSVTKPVVTVSNDIIHYIVMCVGLFARKYNLTKREACNYLSRFKGLEFSINNYEVEHQLSLENCVEDMAAICKRNGGAIS